jgi:hypothetical protein
MRNKLLYGILHNGGIVVAMGDVDCDWIIYCKRLLPLEVITIRMFGLGGANCGC